MKNLLETAQRCIQSGLYSNAEFELRALLAMPAAADGEAQKKEYAQVNYYLGKAIIEGDRFFYHAGAAQKEEEERCREARGFFEAAIEYDASLPMPHLYMAGCAACDADALSHIDQAIEKIHQNYSQYKNLLGEAEIKKTLIEACLDLSQQKYEEDIHHAGMKLLNVLEEDPKNVQAHDMIAFVYEDLGFPVRALYHAKEARELNLRTGQMGYELKSGELLQELWAEFDLHKKGFAVFSTSAETYLTLSNLRDREPSDYDMRFAEKALSQARKSCVYTTTEEKTAEGWTIQSTAPTDGSQILIELCQVRINEILSKNRPYVVPGDAAPVFAEQGL